MTVKTFAYELGGLRFKFPAGEIRHSVANAHHYCDISLKIAMLPGCEDVEMGPASRLHASAYDIENERFDLIEI